MHVYSIFVCVPYVGDKSIHSYARVYGQYEQHARTYIDTLIVELCVLFVVNMDTLNTFRRVGYTEAIARHYRNANLQYIMRSYMLTSRSRSYTTCSC